MRHGALVAGVLALSLASARADAASCVVTDPGDPLPSVPGGTTLRQCLNQADGAVPAPSEADLHHVGHQ